jgi:hypothetical protein
LGTSHTPWLHYWKWSCIFKLRGSNKGVQGTNVRGMFICPRTLSRACTWLLACETCRFKSAAVVVDHVLYYEYCTD